MDRALHRFTFRLTAILFMLNSITNIAASDIIPGPQDTLYTAIDSLFSHSKGDIPSLIKLADEIIGSYPDKILQTTIAGYIFNKFSHSEIMGLESVAIHVAKKYFLSGELEWNGYGGIALLNTYIEFNENSLIGMKAPALKLQNLKGDTIPLLSLQSRYTIVYFFDHNCSVCRETLPELKNIAKRFNSLNVHVYAVFTQQDTTSLKCFINNQFNNNELQNWHFVYDKTGNSNYHKLYNVISTPRLYLLNREKTIIGRSLDNNSLSTLLEQEQSKITQSYDLAQSFIEQYLSLFNLKDSTELETALTPLSERLIEENKDMYNAVFYTLFNHFASHEEQYLKEAAIETAYKYILPHKTLWYDTLFIRQIIPSTIDKIINNRPGSPFPYSTFYNKKDRKKGIENIKARYTYIYFFDIDCSLCKLFSHELKKVHKELKRKNVKIIAIYTGSDNKKLRKYMRQESPPWEVLYAGPHGETIMYENYEIPYIPQTYLLDSEKKIIAKGINTIKIKKYIK